MQVPQIKNIRNKSTLDLNDNKIMSFQNIKDNFRSKSQIGKMLSDIPQQPSNIQNLVYNNKISDIKKQFSVPKISQARFQKSNKEYNDFLSSKKKFVKPYDQHTKFVDSINKNKALLRRGQFDVPVTSDITNTSLNNSKIEIFRSQRPQQIRTKFANFRKNQQLERLNKKVGADKKKGFDKTLNEQYQSYQNLMNVQRWQKKEEINIKNSMNRILAAEMIQFSLLKNQQGSIKKIRSVQLRK